MELALTAICFSPILFMIFLWHSNAPEFSSPWNNTPCKFLTLTHADRHHLQLCENQKPRKGTLLKAQIVSVCICPARPPPQTPLRRRSCFVKPSWLDGRGSSKWSWRWSGSRRRTAVSRPAAANRLRRSRGYVRNGRAARSLSAGIPKPLRSAYHYDIALVVVQNNL